MLRGERRGLCAGAEDPELGHECEIVAPSLIPRRLGERRKHDRKDAEDLARLYRAGELVTIWVPSEREERVQDLVRCQGGGCGGPFDPPTEYYSTNGLRDASAAFGPHSETTCPETIPHTCGSPSLDN